MTRAILLAGGNVGDTAAVLERAEALLAERVGIVTLRSSRYTTEAWGFEATQPFVNQLFAVDTELDPEPLLDTLQGIEAELGRDRAVEAEWKAQSGARYTSRTLDLDILFYGDRMIRTARLTVPHPLIGERTFALEPLCECFAELRHPESGRTMRALLDDLYERENQR